MKLAQLKVKIKLFSKKINKTKMMIFIKIIFLHKIIQIVEFKNIEDHLSNRKDSFWKKIKI